MAGTNVVPAALGVKSGTFGYSANSGAIANTITINNQFQ